MRELLKILDDIEVDSESVELHIFGQLTTGWQ